MKTKLFLALIFTLSAFLLWAQDTKIGNAGLTVAEFIKLKKEIWYKIYFQNQEIGYLHLALSETLWQNQKVISQYTEMLINVKRFSQKVENKIVTINILNEELQPLAVMSYDYLPFSDPVVKECLMYKKQLKVKTVTGKKTEELSFSIPDDFTSDLAVTLDMLRAGFKQGWKRKYTLFNSTSLNFEENTTEVLGQEKVDFLGESRVVNEVKTVSNSGSLPLEIVEWYDDQGDFLVSEERTTGVKFERTTKQAALSGDRSMDLNSFTIVPANKIEKPEKVSYLKLRLSSSQDQALHQFIEDDRQHTFKQDAEYFMEVRSKLFTEDESLSLPLDTHYEDERFIKAGSLIQADDKDIVSLAIQIVGNEKNAWRACKKIADWLRKNIRPSYRMMFLSAKEVLEKKEGDCTEFAVLFAALTRAIGIPAKVNVGLVYVGGQFYYHAWNEVLVGGWVPIDAALGQYRVDATHLKIYSGDLSSASDSFVKIIQVMGRLQIEVITYKADGNQ
jgi:hypothetical protein